MRVFVSVYLHFALAFLFGAGARARAHDDALYDYMTILSILFAFKRDQEEGLFGGRD